MTPTDDTDATFEALVELLRTQEAPPLSRWESALIALAWLAGLSPWALLAAVVIAR